MGILIITTIIISLITLIAWIADMNVKYILKVIFWIILAIVFFKIISLGIKQHEQNECTALLKQKENIGEIWFSADWQKKMCSTFNIEL